MELSYDLWQTFQNSKISIFYTTLLTIYSHKSHPCCKRGCQLKIVISTSETSEFVSCETFCLEQLWNETERSDLLVSIDISLTQYRELAALHLLTRCMRAFLLRVLNCVCVDTDPIGRNSYFFLKLESRAAGLKSWNHKPRTSFWCIDERRGFICFDPLMPMLGVPRKARGAYWDRMKRQRGFGLSPWCSLVTLDAPVPRRSLMLFRCDWANNAYPLRVTLWSTFGILTWTRNGIWCNGEMGRKKVPNHILVGSAHRNSDSAVLRPYYTQGLSRIVFCHCWRFQRTQLETKAL